MGQKTDARIFRQGVLKKNWEIKHLEKNNEESSLYIYKTLEIQKYLNRFFGLYKIKVHNCKVFYSDSSLQIFVSFYLTTKTVYIINKKLTTYSKKFSMRRSPFKKKKENLMLLDLREKLKRRFKLKKLSAHRSYKFAFFRKEEEKLKMFGLWRKLRKKRRRLAKNSKKQYKSAFFKKRRRKLQPFSWQKKLETKKSQKIKNRKNLLFRSFKVNQTNDLRRDFQKVKNKRNLSLKSFKANQSLKKFQEILIESLASYTKNKVKISVTLQNLNRYKRLSHAQIKNLIVIFKQLKKFVRNSFFKEAINILFVNVSKRKSAKLMAEFISDQFRLNQLRTDQMAISRKDNYFLGFLKQTVMLLIKSEVSRLTGIKIVIKGRFNRAPRAKTSNICFGTFPLQSFDSKIDYYQSTAYTINGTFGVKVWLCEKKY